MKLLLVDSSEVFRMGLRAALGGHAGRDLRVVAEAADAAAARALVAAAPPDMVVTDLHLRDRNGVMLTRELRAMLPSLRVLILAVQAPEAVVNQALAAGATGYLLKWQSADEIREAVRLVAAGGTALPRDFRARAADRAHQGRGARPPLSIERLSHREREIFDLVVWGHSNRQMAEQLAISIKTVETHRSHINGKLRVHTGADLVRLASLWGVLGTGGNNGTAAAPPS